MSRMRSALLVSAAVVTVALAGCSAPNTDATTQSGQAASANAVEAAQPATVPTASDLGPVTETLKVGETRKGKGVHTTVANPRQFTTSSTAAPQQGEQAIAFDVTFRNVSKDQPMPTSMLMFAATVDNRQAPQVFDSAQGFEGQPVVDVLPGRTLTFPLAFVDPTGKGDVVVQMRAPTGDTFYFTLAR